MMLWTSKNLKRFCMSEYVVNFSIMIVGKRSALAELTCKHRWSLDNYYLNCQSTTLLVCLLLAG